MPNLRDFQQVLVNGVYDAWRSGARVVMPVAPTGAGKTVVSGHIVTEVGVPTTAIAHRAELVSQMSLALARNGIRHRVVGPEKLEKLIQRLHIEELDRDYTNRHATTSVAGVDTLIRLSPSDPIFSNTRLWLQDEGHHVLQKNKWGKAASMFRPDCLGLAPTATPGRADGKGLGRHADGLVDTMVMGPTMRDLIDQGYLCDYKCKCPPSDLNRAHLHISAGGDFEPKEMAASVRKSTVTGDIVKTYLKESPGLLDVVFAADIEHAVMVARGMRDAGVRSEVITGETPPDLRARLLRQFARREILVLVNVDLFGEGFDLPAVDVVSMGRPTQSFALYAQQFGRGARLSLDSALLSQWYQFDVATRKRHIAESRKPYFMVFDHVGNIMHHGLPDRPRRWSLDRRDSRARSDNDREPDVVCPSCTGPYPRILRICPYCKEERTPNDRERSSIETIDGDLEWLDPLVLAKMRGEIIDIDTARRVPGTLDGAAAAGFLARDHEKRQEQARLRQVMATYGGLQTGLGRPLHEAQRRFYHAFGVDVLTAQSLARAEAEALRLRIESDLRDKGVQI